MADSELDVFFVFFFFKQPSSPQALLSHFMKERLWPSE